MGGASTNEAPRMTKGAGLNPPPAPPTRARILRVDVICAKVLPRHSIERANMAPIFGYFWTPKK